VPEQFRINSGDAGYLLTLPGEHAGFDGGFCQRMRKVQRTAE